MRESPFAPKPKPQMLAPAGPGGVWYKIDGKSEGPFPRYMSESDARKLVSSRALLAPAGKGGRYFTIGGKLRGPFGKYTSIQEATKMVQPLAHAGSAEVGIEMNGKMHYVSKGALGAKCSEWRKNKGVNPLTGRSIEKNGPTYQKLQELCDGGKMH